MFEERLLLGIGVELPDVAGSPSTNTEKLEPRVFSQVARNSRRSSRLRRTSGLAGANSGVLRQVRERHHAIPDLSRSFLDGERLYRIHTHTVENDVSVLRDLEQEHARAPGSARLRAGFAPPGTHSPSCRTQSLHQAIQANEVERAVRRSLRAACRELPAGRRERQWRRWLCPLARFVYLSRSSAMPDTSLSRFSRLPFPQSARKR